MSLVQNWLPLRSQSQTILETEICLVKNKITADSPILEIVSYNLRKIRKSRGWTQKELAERAGLSDQSVRKLEKDAGSSTILTYLGVCKALWIHPDRVLEFDCCVSEDCDFSIPDNVLGIIGENLYRVRTERNLSRKELANHAGIHHLGIFRYERGGRNISFRQFVQLIRTLKLNPSDLLISAVEDQPCR